METGATRRRVLAGAVCAGLGLAAAAGGVRAQEAAPRVPAGVRLAVLPVQQVAPAPSGAWPGGASSAANARGRMNAELDYAISSSEDAAGWAGPGALGRMVERNPMIDADPHRLAVDRLSEIEPGEGQLREPLHRQLRRLSALAQVRLAAIPVRLTWRPPEELGDGEDGDGGDAGGGDEADAGGGAPDDTAPGAGEDAGAAEGRTVLELVVVDTRAARVLWRGEVRGRSAPPDEPGTLAKLASNLVGLLTP